jgi:small-conductance mechanosensitive channel
MLLAEVTTSVQNTGDAVRTAFTDALSVFFRFIPHLIGALILLLLGLIVGRLVGTIVTKALRAIRFDQVAERAEIGPFLRNAGIRLDAAGVIGGLIKWFIYIIFFQAAANILGFSQLTTIMNQILAFIPRVIVALVIVLIGALVGKLLADLVRGGLRSARFGEPEVLANVARFAVLAFAVVAALSQLEIAPAIVNTLWTAVIGGVALAAALAFGLGAREAAGHVTTGQLIKGEIPPGMQIAVDGQEGTVEKVGALYTTVSVAGGREVKIPNAELARRSVEITGGTPREQPPRTPVARQAPPQMQAPPPHYQEPYPPQYPQGSQPPPYQPPAPPYQPPGQPMQPPGRPIGQG